MNQPKNSSFAIHCHHNILVEYCYNYKKRVKTIKQNKPLSEQATRLRLFKLLPDNALKEIPQNWQKADTKWQKTRSDCQKTYNEWKKTRSDWQKAYDDWQKADQDAFHQKWCGCKEWNGREIAFPKEEQNV